MPEKITLTYLNIRQSIAILVAKLVTIDLIFAGITVLSFFFLIQTANFIQVITINTRLFLTLFLVIGTLKIFFSAYIVLLWLNEYYEITPDYIIHNRGIIFRKSEQYRLDYVRAMDVEDTFLGEIFNFATITLYDIRLNKYLDMYLIHNPRRYAQIIKTLLPQIEIKKDRVRLPFMPKEENTDIEEIYQRKMPFQVI
jgi:hypothetical protein